MKTVRGNKIHQLFAKKKADAMSSDAANNKNQIRNLQILCKKYNVLSNVTSFVLVEQRKVATTTTPELVNIPLARPKPAPLTAQTIVTNGTVSLGGKFSMNYKATIGADFTTCRIVLADREVRVQLWDPCKYHSFMNQIFTELISEIFSQPDLNDLVDRREYFIVVHLQLLLCTTCILKLHLTT